MKLCPDDPGTKEIIEPALQKFISSMKDHPSLLAWSIWNEPGYSEDICYCRDTKAKFGKTPPLSLEKENGEKWLSWMKFRQKSLIDFFQWIKNDVQEIDPHHPLTVKAVWCPMDSRKAWSHATRYDYWNQVCDVMGHDPYPHPYDFFIIRWVADWMRSSAPDKPLWFPEFNRAFVRERGLAGKEEIRAWTWQSIAHGVRGFFYFFYPMNPIDPQAGDNVYSLSKPESLEDTPALEEIYRLSEEVKQIAPLLREYKIPDPEIAMLHSWPTQFQMAGEMYPTSNETVIAEMLYRIGHRLNWVTERDIREGKLKRYKLLFVTGTVAISDETLQGIREFHENGGYLIACARFAELDENGKKREDAPPEYFGVNVLETNQYEREKQALPPFIGKIRNFSGEEEIDRVERYRYNTSFPIKWDPPLFEYFYDAGMDYEGEEFSGGDIIGFEDMKCETETIEKITAAEDALVLGSFKPLTPAIIATPRTIYIARDLAWSGDAMLRFIDASLRRAKIEPYVSVFSENEEYPAWIDTGVLESNDGKRLIIISCSGKIYQWDATPRKIFIRINAMNEFVPVKGDGVIQKNKEFQLWEKTFSPGEVLILKEK